MKLMTVLAVTGQISAGFVLPLKNPRDHLRHHPPLRPYLELGEEKSLGQLKRVPVHPELLPMERGANVLLEGELVRTRNLATNKSTCEAHGYELVCATTRNDSCLLVLIDTRGSRKQPNTTAGWKIIEGRAENKLIGSCLRGKSGRDGTCYVGLVVMWPGSEILVRPEGRPPFLLVYQSIESGLLCDMDAIENGNKVKAAVRYQRSDELRTVKLQEKTTKREVYQAKNKARREQLTRERTWRENRERSVRQSCFKRTLRFIRELREVKDPKERIKILARRLKSLQKIRVKKLLAKNSAARCMAV